MSPSTRNEVTPVDLLAVGAHPDDVEVGIGGMVYKFAQAGQRVGILDLTRGEMGTRGTPDERAAEAAQAAKVLGVAHRAHAELPDGGIANVQEQRIEIIGWLRAFRPRVLLAPYHTDRHPDHDAAHHLIRAANYFAGLAKLETGQDPHRTPTVYYYRVYGDSTPPQIAVNISVEFDVKIRALQSYQSQFHNPEYAGAPTYVSSEAFWQSIETRARYWGQRIGVTYAETLYADEPIALDFPPGITAL
jgi:N-acetylglucosamine malate deacetylase 1